MAQFGALTLFVWAAVVALSSCQSFEDDPDSSTTNKPITPTPITSKLDTLTPNNSSSMLQVTPSQETTTQNISTTATVEATTEAMTEAMTEDPNKKDSCSFSVRPVDFGLQIQINDSGIYRVSVSEINQTSFSDPFSGFTHDILNLKPSTQYEVQVQRTNGVNCTSGIDASKSIVTETTRNMKPGDVTYQPRPQMIFFTSDWNISCINVSTNRVSTNGVSTNGLTNGVSTNGSTNGVSTNGVSTNGVSTNGVSTNGVPAKACESGCCFDVKQDDLCTNISVTFSLSGRGFVDVLLLDAEKYLAVADLTPTVTYPNGSLRGHPPNISLQVPLPERCNADIDYKCTNGNSVSKALSELELFKNYKCVGDIKINNKMQTTKTSQVSVDTSCDVSLMSVKAFTSETSIRLEWTTQTKNCNKSLLLPKLHHKCSCSTRSNKTEAASTICSVDGLEAFTNYSCKLQTFYNDHHVEAKFYGIIETKSGKPDNVKSLVATLKEHNAFNVTCNELKTFKGPRGRYSAILKLDGKQVGEEQRSEKCQFEFRDLKYSTTYELDVKAVNGDYQGDSSTVTVITRFNDKALIGFLVLLILITSVALMAVLYKIYVLKRRKSHHLSNHHKLRPVEEERLMDVEPIQADDLLDTYKRKLADEGRLFLGEFQSIPRIFSKFTMKEAKKNCNAIKNRYVDILPYDYNRVPLTTGNGEQGCDYINASFIDGYKEAKKYIAAQGPKEETITDFWRMVWEQKSSVIVMVTRCEEGNRPKCAEYWPSVERGAEIFEEFVVKVTSEDQCPDYTIRHLGLTNKREKNCEREVTHIQFLSWPDHGVPGEPHLLLKLRRRVNAFKNLFSGPIVVHCSAGVGRTGSYIGIDAMMEGLEAEGRVDIYGYVAQLRRQRCLMVQVEAQYILIHQALLEHNQFGETEISLSELHSSVSTLKERSADESPLMDEEFERIPSYKNWRTYNAGIMEENHKLNRTASVVPYDFNRVLLRLEEEPSQDEEEEEDEEEESSDEEEESSKYINASHIDGYWGSRCFIAAQTPLTDTVEDFWLMVHQKRVSTIVMLSGGSQGATECTYLPKERNTFGEVEVEVTSTEVTPVFVSHTMSVRHVKRKECRAVRHYEFLKWAEGDVPEKQELMELLKEVRGRCGSSKTLRTSPALVHCSDGSTRTGLMVALWNLLDSAETEKLVDVFQVVKTLRKERVAMIHSLDQYQFLYDALEALFPAQNGEVKVPQGSSSSTPASAAATSSSVEIVDETKAAERESAATSNDQKEAPESSKATEEADTGEDTSTSPLVTVEV
ncbi:receptor-type tyrosine-protein phosphatase C [Eucyclogobius newberryi]|uniref:receptor-type tyrosine-protein phosphatase C n=1 Tax=Eucyclogobius newberryi TaxID=166745 RepID=UPI003B594F27